MQLIRFNEFSHIIKSYSENPERMKEILTGTDQYSSISLISKN